MSGNSMNLLKEQPQTAPNDLLVPDDFQIGVTKDIERLFRDEECYPGYPSSDRLLKWDDGKISAWEKAGFPDDWIPTMKEAGYNPHPNYLKGLELGRAIEDDGMADFAKTAFEKSFAGNYPKTKRGVPIHPFYKMLLRHGVPAAREWTGFYWGKGPQKAGDPVLLSVFSEETEGRVVRKLKWLGIASKALVENGNKRVNGLPGGMVEPDDPLVTATIRREVFEEAGVPQEFFRDPEIIAQAVVLEGRTGLNAWPESTAALVILLEEIARKIAIKAGDDASKAHWLDASEAVFETLFSPTHAGFIKLGVREWQKRNPGFAVTKDGSILTYPII